MRKQINGTVNWGIIGCGDVCEVKSGPAFQKIPHSKLVAVMRRNAEKAKDYAQRHHVPTFYTEATDLVNDKEVNAVYIATPPSLHEEYTELALKAGKPVYVEKPVTLNAASCERMIAMEKQYGTSVTVAHYRRALPMFQHIKQIVDDGIAGKIKLVELRMLQPPASSLITQTADNWRINPALSGGGLFHDLSPHQLDMLYWIFGEPEESFVKAVNQGKQYNAPDLTMMTAAFAKDIYMQAVWNFNVAVSAAKDECEIIGDKGSIRFSFFRSPELELINAEGTQVIQHQSPEHIQQPFITQVVEFLRGERPNPCSLEEALVTLKLMDRAVL